MTQLTRPASKFAPGADDPAYLAIADKIDAIGQRYRVQRLVRGVVLWITAGIVASLAAAFIAHLIGAAWPSDGSTGGKGSHHVAAAFITIILFAWIAFLVVTAIRWILMPLLMRPRDLQVARLVESRVPGLHNGLTNSVLLAQADDLRQSPFLPAIFREISQRTETQPLNSAVRFSDLRRLAVVSLSLMLAVALLISLPSPREMFMHGLRQMFSPHAFVPEMGAVDELKVQPGDVLMIAGQPLEIGVSAHSHTSDFQPEAKLIIESAASRHGASGGGKVTESALTPTVSDSQLGGAELQYGYRLDRVEDSLRYRVEVAGTQSPWFNVKVVQQVKLRELSLSITPPIYTRKLATQLTFKGDDIAKALAASPISVPQGSSLKIDATVDLPVQAAMLQIGDNGQAAMSAGESHQEFTAETTILDQTSLSILLMEGSQVIARLPDDGLSVQCIKDAAPTIDLEWPAHDLSVPPDAELKIKAIVKDDYGISSAQILMAPGGSGSDQPLTSVWSQQFPTGPVSTDISQTLNIKPELRKHGQSIRIQLTATDNRDLSALMKSSAKSAGQALAGVAVDNGGPQTTSSAVIEIKFSDPAIIAAEQKEKLDQIRAVLMKMLAMQKDLNGKSVSLDAMFAAASKHAPGAEGMLLEHKVNAGQADLHAMMQNTADTFTFDDTTRIVQKTLLVMAGSVAREAIDLSAAIVTEPIVKEQTRDNQQLQGKQRQIISTLESLVALLELAHDPTTRPTVKGSPQMPSEAERWKKLDEALKAFMKEEQRILDQTAALAKKPVDNFNADDKKLLDQLKQSQDKMDAFMQQALSDFSKNAEQDMSNPALLKDLLAVYSEVTMAKDALKKQSTEIAVADEEMGLEGAKEISSNIEKWLSNTPDRQQWTQEDPVGKTDTPMPELPTELEDMVGKLLEQQEDLNQEQEDANANWTDSMDKGVGWDAADGPIADMSAKGVTGNTLPNDNEMAGRSGEGRSGKSQGEFVGDTAQGKGGRNTPTRLDPTPFQQGQINDQSKDPVGGATGGGKLSGQGAAGLEGPVPPKIKQEMQRLADKQAQIRNQAERLQLNYHLGKYDNFSLYRSILLMRRNESDLRANRYQNTMRNRDVIVDELGTSKMLLGGTVDVQQDATPAANAKMRQDINDAMKGDLPAAWSDALKEYYKKLAEQ